MILRFIFVLTLVLGTFSTQAYDFQVDGIYYTITSMEQKTVEVACGNPGDTAPKTRDLEIPTCQDWPGNSYNGDVVIPEYVIHDGTKYHVTAVGLGAFVHCSELTSVILPESIVSIRGEAFSGCKTIEHIYLPDGITHIGGMTFRGCESLTEIDYPKSCEYIYSLTFGGCGSRKGEFKLTGYENVIQISEYVFGECPIKYLDFSDSKIEIIDVNLLMGCNFEELVLPTNRSDEWYERYLGNLISPLKSLQNLTIYNTVPPQLPDTYHKSIFQHEGLKDCVLHVPTESIDAYRNADFWKNFPNIVSGVERIPVERSMKKTIYNLNGTGITSGNPTVPGIYIEKTEKGVRKIIVR